MFGGPDPTWVRPWRPTVTVPAEVDPILGVWFWGNTAVELRWQNDALQLRALRNAQLSDTFELRDGRLVGTSGYHRGETLHVVRRDDAHGQPPRLRDLHLHPGAVRPGRTDSGCLRPSDR